MRSLTLRTLDRLDRVPLWVTLPACATLCLWVAYVLAVNLPA